MVIKSPWLEKLARAAAWIATGDVSRELTTACLLQKVVIFLMRLATVAFLYALFRDVALHGWANISQVVGVFWVASVR